MRITQMTILIIWSNQRTRRISLYSVISVETPITQQMNAGWVHVIDVELPVIEPGSVKWISLLLEKLLQTLAQYPELVVCSQDSWGVVHREELI